MKTSITGLSMAVALAFAFSAGGVTAENNTSLKSHKKAASTSGYSVIEGGASGVSTITRYWDCCKVSCGWKGKASVTNPVDTCGKNGISLVDDNTQSGCAGGSM